MQINKEMCTRLSQQGGIWPYKKDSHDTHPAATGVKWKVVCAFRPFYNLARFDVETICETSFNIYWYCFQGVDAFPLDLFYDGGF